MFSKEEIKRNLLGCFEVALFMPAARQRFGSSRKEALRSFWVPVMVFPLTLLAVYYYPAHLINDSAHTIAVLYSLRMIVAWLLFFGIVYWIASEIDRKDRFYQFVIASNWLSIPATMIFAPVALMLLSGAYDWDYLYPFSVCLMLYSYAFSAFMIAHVLRIPWELAGFITFIGFSIDNNTLDIIHWVGGIL